MSCARNLAAAAAWSQGGRMRKSHLQHHIDIRPWQVVGRPGGVGCVAIIGYRKCQNPIASRVRMHGIVHRGPRPGGHPGKQIRRPLAPLE